MFVYAPMEGITDGVYRRVHRRFFPGLDFYYIPFVSPTQNLTLTSREYAAISPLENEGVPVIPQILTKEPEHFFWSAARMADMGYESVNLNLGCPSGTVTAKGKGAGALRDLSALRRLLDGIYEKAPLPVSLKTRIGYESPEEWPRLLEVFSDYPVHLLIVHPRTRAQLYHDLPSLAAWQYAKEHAQCPLCFNGNLNTPADIAAFEEKWPQTPAMLGRGLLQNPALHRQAQGGEALSRQELLAFHDALLRTWSEKHPRNVSLNRMREVMKYMALNFEDCEKPLKIIRKAKTEEEYRRGAMMLFEEREMIAPETRKEESWVSWRS